ncbi:MAG: hypothetical protein ABW127_17815 [Candidatus Thiodiazotropha endolucinida]
MPLRDIKLVVSIHKVDVIGQSFNGHFKHDIANIMLSGLRQMIEDKKGIWLAVRLILMVPSCRPG